MFKLKQNSDEFMLGRTFGKLTVIARCEEHYFPNGRHRDVWLCRCECGNEKEILGVSIRSGVTKTCGCRVKEGLRTTHGMSDTRLYKCWQDMKSRCYNVKNKRYPRYGGRDIKVCKEWFVSFETFAEWAYQNGYDDKLTLDRVDVDWHYEPENCRWADRETQANNTTRNRYLTAFGETKTISEWARQNNIKPNTILARIDRFGWDAEKAITEVVK